MYNKGDLKLVLTSCPDPCPHPELKDGFCDHEPQHEEAPRDARENYESQYPCVYLPHSCDKWVIGGPLEVKLLIEELQIALSLLESS